jgi:hypothetical protein
MSLKLQGRSCNSSCSRWNHPLGGGLGLPQAIAALDAAKLPEAFMTEADRDRSIVQPRPALEQLFENEDKGKN